MTRILIIMILFHANQLTADWHGTNQRIRTFANSKQKLSIIYKHRPKTFYCGCSYQDKRILANSCNYRPKRISRRAFRIEWEHIVPASFWGKNFEPWTKGSSECVKSSGKKYKGRKCAHKVSHLFRRMEADMYNLVPAIGSINAARSDYIMGIIPGEQRYFGGCDFEIDRHVIEPRAEIRGDIARIHLYMMSAYPNKVELTTHDLKMMLHWDRLDPPTSSEMQLGHKIEQIQGNRNHYLDKNYPRPAGK